MMVAIVLACASCGGSKPVHYRVEAALDCIRRADDTTFPRVPPHGIYAAFLSPDGVSAIETIAVAFAPASAEMVANAPAPTRLGVPKPTWTETRGDAEMWGFGPRVPPIAKRQGIPAGDAERAAQTLGRRVRAAIDDCLKQNER
jgi:hypothetical protein